MAEAVTRAPAIDAGSTPDELDAAIDAGDVATALALLLDSLQDDDASGADRARQRSQLARTIAAVGEPVDVTATVRPYVELLLTLRSRARTDKRFADSDAIRDGLTAAGIEVRDTPDGASWEVRA